MYRTFNCGIGMVVVAAPEAADAVAAELTAAGEQVFQIGRIINGERGCTVTGSTGTWSARAPWRASHDA